MRKSRFFACVAIILVFASMLGACTPDSGSVHQTTISGEGGSDIAVETTKKETTEKETTEAPKYSAEDKLVALTFDDGPRKSTTNRILDVLEKHNGAATFFLVGYNIDSNIDTIKRAQALGCEIANHSENHKKLTKCTPEEIREQVDKPNAKIKNLTGAEVRLFRAPGGNFKGIEETIGMPLIQWSIDTNDWKYKDAANKGRTPEKREQDINAIADNVLSQVQKGDIILMHDIYDFTADLCEVLIPRLAEEGYKLATVSEMYEAYGKELEGGKVYRCIRPAVSQQENV